MKLFGKGGRKPLKTSQIEKFASQVGNVAQAKSVVKRLAEQFQIPVSYGGISFDPDSDAYLYRNVSVGRILIDRKLLDIEQEKLQRVGHFLYKTNPLAKRGIDLIVQYVIGDGITFQAENEKVYDCLLRHWEDPTNDWPLKQGDRLRDLLIFGEAFYPPFVAKHTGNVRLGYLDPYLVAQVVPIKDDVSIPGKVIRRAVGGDPKELTYDVIRQDGENYTGDIFYFAMNRLMSASRGYSLLLPVADWLDAWDRFVFARAENRAMIDEFNWDITLQNATQEEADDWLNRQDRSSGSGKWRVHDQNVEWKAVAPQLGAADAREESKLLMGQILSGYGLPVTWMTGMGDDVNRASALALGDPTMMSLQAIQGFYKHIIKSILEYHLWSVKSRSSAALSGVKDEEMTFEVIAPPINIENQTEIADTMTKVANAMLVAEQQGWVDKKTAAQVFAESASRIGQEVTIAEDLQEEQVKESKPNLKVYGKAYGF